MKSPHWHNAIWGNNHPLTSYFRASRVPVFWASRLHFFSIYFLRYNTRTSESQSAHCYRCSLGRVLGRETVFWAVKRLGHTFGFYIKKLGFPVVSLWFYHRLKEDPGQHLTCLDRRSTEVLPPERKPRAWRTCFLTEVKNVNSGLVNSWLIISMGISGS